VSEEGDFEKIRQSMLGALQQLKESDMVMIEMRFFEERPFKEIAQILSITESNAKVKTYRILEKMKKIMKKNS
jgi:RNA polymerase sigma-70 factor (ECF subfamily)